MKLFLLFLAQLGIPAASAAYFYIPMRILVPEFSLTMPSFVAMYWAVFFLMLPGTLFSAFTAPPRRYFR